MSVFIKNKNKMLKFLWKTKCIRFIGYCISSYLITCITIFKHSEIQIIYQNVIIEHDLV